VQLTAMPLMVETDRIVMKQISGTAMSIYTGFAKIQRKASLVDRRLDPLQRQRIPDVHGSDSRITSGSNNNF
jgi:hypothetical protein